MDDLLRWEVKLGRGAVSSRWPGSPS